MNREDHDKLVSRTRSVCPPKHSENIIEWILPHLISYWKEFMINWRNKSVNLKIRWRFYKRIHSRWRKQQHLYHHKRMLKWQSCKLKWLLWIDNWLKQKKQRTRGFNSCKKCMKLRTNLSKNWVSKITNWIKRSRLRIRGNSWYKKCLKLRKN